MLDLTGDLIGAMCLSLETEAAPMSGSWQSIVDDQLIGGGQVSSAAILGLDGTVLATSSGFSLNPGEGAALAANVSNPGSVYSTGINVAGTKYFPTNTNATSIYGKKGSSGVILVKTNQAILIGLYSDQLQPGNAANSVETLGTLLRDNGS